MKAKDPGEFARARAEPGDSLSGAWYLSQLVAFMTGLSGLALLWSLGAGSMGGALGRHPIAAVAVGASLMIGAAGLFLRIDAARVFLLGLTGLIARAAAGFWIVLVAGADPGGSGGPRFAAALVFGALSVALAAPASRRLCSRWGLLRRR